jgi:hypothetical protein
VSHQIRKGVTITQICIYKMCASYHVTLPYIGTDTYVGWSLHFILHMSIRPGIFKVMEDNGLPQI